MSNNYLKILDLSIGATKAEIKAAYRKLSKKYHPDINKNEDAKERFIAINEAYKFLMDVGPKPNNEKVTYNYNAHDIAYEEWRKRAREYAWRKAREAQRQQQQQLSRILYYFDFVAIAIIIFNIALAVDYLLPKNVVQDKVIHIKKVYEGGSRYEKEGAHRYDDIYFEHFYMRVNKEKYFKIAREDKAMVTATFLFEIPLYVEISKGVEKVKLKQVYSVYAAFGFIIPIMFLLGLFYKIILRNLDHRLTLAILMTMLFPLQLFLFFMF